MDQNAAPNKARRGKGDTRHAARLAALQAIYSMEVSGAGVLDTLADYEGHWMRGEADGLPLDLADIGYFRDLVQGVLRLQRQIDPLIDQTLNEKWPLKRVDAVMRALLRVATYELIHRKDVPEKVILFEAVDLAKGFFDAEEWKMVNGVLDTISSRVRSQGAPV